jgi:hypothetical protein
MNTILTIIGTLMVVALTVAVMGVIKLWKMVGKLEEQVNNNELGGYDTINDIQRRIDELGGDTLRRFDEWTASIDRRFDKLWTDVHTLEQKSK